MNSKINKMEPLRAKIWKIVLLRALRGQDPVD